MDKNDENKSLYKKLKEIRRARGLTVNNLAEKIGENSQKVGRIERGTRSLTVDYLLKVSKALETPMNSLLEVENSTENNNSEPEILNDVVLFVEEQCKHLSIQPQQKAQLISKLYTLTSKFPRESQKLFLQSLAEALLLLK